ncbi:MAG TPA: cell division protein SepF [Streptosporangiaceae bacterium]|nr:cell division protein SepF [Streptosporangiaceae bacterium]
MAGAIHKMAVYLGLVEDDQAYDDGFDGYADDEYADYDDEAGAPASGSGQPGPGRNGHMPEGGGSEGSRVVVAQSTELVRITTLHPRTYNEARTIGEHFREGTPVIMNLTEMVDSDAKRLVDFAAGLIFGLRGDIERVTNKVFLLSPANIEVTAEDKARIAQRGFFNQS